MKAVATAEKRPAYLFISGTRNKLAVATHEYQDGIEVVMVFFVKVLVVFVRLFSELFVEAGLGIWLLWRESRFYRVGHVIAPSIHSVRPWGGNSWSDAGV